MKNDISLFNLDPYSVRFLSPKDFPVLNDLCNRCSDYFIMVTGSPPGPDTGPELYFELPPGKEEKDKILLGFFDIEGKMIGILDLLKDYPAENIDYIGLMMIDPCERRKGLGKVIIDRLEAWLKLSGTSELQLGVVRQNIKALNFWKEMGFVEIGETIMEVVSQKFLNIIKMKKTFDSDESHEDSADHFSILQ